MGISSLFQLPKLSQAGFKKINPHLAILLGVFVILVITNFPFTSWMSGWDNLHPEFNFLLNVQRGLTAVWQDNQGLGTYGGHGYAATLLHTLFLWILSLILPAMYLRSFFTFLCLLVGALGVYYFTQKLFSHASKSHQLKAGLLAGLFYMLNFGTVQNFYIQLEAFIVHFALLPWLLLALIQFLEKPTRKHIILFVIVSLVSSIQGFIPPLFFVYAILLGIYVATFLLAHFTFDRIKKVLLVIVITLCMNAYWLLPVINYTFTRSDTYLNAYNNLSSTEDFILKNQKYGTITDVAVLKGFISEAIDSSELGVFPIFSQWLRHISMPLVQGIGFIFFGTILLGVVALLRKNRNYVTIATCIGLICIFTLLATDTPPFSFISNAFQQIPVLKQAFRVAFTKFSISLSFFYALFFGIGCMYAASLILHIVKERFHEIMNTTLTGALIALLVYFSLPTFTGNFLYARTKLTIPSMYFEVFDFFKHQDKNTRIANLPQGWNWGWSVYNWGYSGSGFLWYGIEQPIMDRAFDVWGRNNENYYWELSYAIYSENFQLFEKVLDKYHVDWVMLDKNIVPYLNSKGYIYSSKFEKYLSQANKFTLAKKFTPKEKGIHEVLVYKVKHSQELKNFTTDISLSQLSNIGPSYTFSNYDQAYVDYGTYYTDASKKFDAYYPFRSLFINKRADPNKFSNLPIAITENTNELSLAGKLPYPMQDHALNIAANQPLDQSKVTVSQSETTFKVAINTQHAPVYTSENDPYFKNHTASNCKDATPPDNTFKQTTTKDGLEFYSQSSENCYTILLSTLSQRFAYLVSVANSHQIGKRLQLAILNEDSKKSDIEFPLSGSSSSEKSYVIIPPMKYYGLGYSLLFNNIAIGNKTTVNTLQNVTLYEIPYIALTGMSLLNPSKTTATTTAHIYYQSFDPGWKAYTITDQNWLKTAFPFLFGKEIKNHILINNWANGWEIAKDQGLTTHDRLIIVYLPQYLEYIGLFLMVLCVAILTILFFKKSKARVLQSYPHHTGHTTINLKK